MHIEQLQVGAAQVSILNAGDLRFDLADTLNAPESERHGRHAQIFERPLHVPVQCILLQLPQATVLVDASRYDTDPDSPFFIADYTPPPDILQQLAALTIEPQAIQHVVFTHAHFDHYNGATVACDGQFEPAYANARFYLGHADWASTEMQQALRDLDSTDSRTLGVLYAQGRLELVAESREIVDGVHIILSPGETPGHLCLRLQSEGKTLYCVGDLYHHPVEVEHPAWAVSWADVVATEASRRQLVEAAMSEDAIIVATHIPGAGRLVTSAGGVRWDAA